MPIASSVRSAPKRVHPHLQPPRFDQRPVFALDLQAGDARILQVALKEPVFRAVQVAEADILQNYAVYLGLASLSVSIFSRPAYSPYYARTRSCRHRFARASIGSAVSSTRSTWNREPEAEIVRHHDSPVSLYQPHQVHVIAGASHKHQPRPAPHHLCSSPGRRGVPPAIRRRCPVASWSRKE